MRIDNDLTPKVIQCDIHGHNGTAFSPDKQWMFTSDTPNGVIFRTRLMSRANRAGARCFVSLIRARDTGRCGDGCGRLLLERAV